MFYTIYKISNLIDGKIYIGKHETKNLNDGYMGSGKHLRYAIEKYGIYNFKKEILFQFDNEAEMNAKEAELVTEEFCLREDTYNLCPGGKGGWGYVNSNQLGLFKNKSLVGKQKSIQSAIYNISKANTKEFYNQKIQNLKLAAEARLKKYPDGPFKGKSHTEETKSKISKANSRMIGSKNSQHGTMWITDGQNNKKIKKDFDVVPEGWVKGRTSLKS